MNEDFQQALQQIINDFGEDVLTKDNLVNIASDYYSFDRSPAIRTILKAIYKEGYANKIYQLRNSKGNPSIDLERYANEMEQNWGYSKEQTQYVFSCIASCIGIEYKTEPTKTNNSTVVVDIPKETTSTQEHKDLITANESLLKPKDQIQNHNEPEIKHEEGKKKSSLILITIGILLLLICGGLGGYFYYQNVYIPEKTDREAPRYYTFAPSVILRSSKVAGSDFNKLGSLPYGTELITYDYGSEWCEVKVNMSNIGTKPVKGFVASPYVLNKKDFFLLNSIFGDTDSKETVSTSKCRLALLNYYKEHGFYGSMSYEILVDAGFIEANDDKKIPYQFQKSNQWQVFSRPAKMKPNSTYYKRLVNSESKFTDFAVIISNLETGERKLLYFYFLDDETPIFLGEQEAPEYGYIEKIEKRNDDIIVTYSGND